MLDKTVTIFNRYESSTGVMWYPHVISGVTLITDRSAILKKYGPDSTDAAKLYIDIQIKDGKMIVIDKYGTETPWLSPKEWVRQVNNELAGTITFQTKGNCFFWEGEWTDGPVNDEDYYGSGGQGFYSYMDNRYDFVYSVTTVGGPYTVIPHFEILGA